MHKIKFLYTFIMIIGILSIVPIACNASTSDALLIDDYYSTIKSIYNDQIDAPNVLPKEKNVNLYDGSYSLSETDLTIPGKNGLDINITRKFNSFSSSCGVPMLHTSSSKMDFVGMLGYYYDTYKDGKLVGPVLVGFNDELEAIANQEFVGAHPQLDEEGKLRDTDYYKTDSMGNEYVKFMNIGRSEGGYTYKLDANTPPIALYTAATRGYTFESMAGKIMEKIDRGWYLSKPGMETHLKIRESYGYDTYVDLYGVFQTLEGKVLSWEGYFWEGEDKPLNGKFCFKTSSEYRAEFADNDLSVSVKHPHGFKYNFIIVNDNCGIKYYFDAEGNLKTGKYYLKGIEDKYGNIIQYNDDGREIVDTYGNKIKISVYSNYNVQGRTVTINNGSGEQVLLKYTLTTVNNNEEDPYEKFILDDSYVFTTIKAEDGYEIDDSPNKTEYWMCQKRVHNRIYTAYENSPYEYYTQLIPYEVRYPDGAKQIYSHNTMLARVTRVLGNGGLLEGDSCFITESYDLLQGNESKKNHYEYSYVFLTKYNYASYGLWSNSTVVTRIHDNQKKTYTFTGLSTSKQPQNRMIETIKTTKGNNKREESLRYSHLMLSSHTVTDYNGSYTSSVTKNVTYDDYKNVTKEKIGDKTVDYTYDTPETSPNSLNHYSVMLSQTYNLDVDTTVTIRNTLTADRKSIASSSTYENNTLKSTVNYTYNSDGTVASESIALSDGTIILNTYCYDYYSDGSRKISKTIKNRVDADGNPIPDITTSVKYDFLGNPIESVDGNGNITYNKYDIQGRLLKTAYPNYTEKSNSYDILANTVISTDQNGNKIKYQFNSYGDFVGAYVWSNYSWKILESQDYDALDRPSEFIQYRDDNTYYSVANEYDGFDRITSQTIKDEKGNIIKKVSSTYNYLADSNGRTNTRVIRRLSDSAGSAPSYTITLYDYRGLTLETSAIGSDDTITQSYTYDYMGNMLTSTNPNGAISAYEYDYSGNLVAVTNAEGYTSLNGYDEAGRMIWSKDFDDNITSYYYDTAGMNIKTVFPFDENSTSTVKKYYDNNCNLVTESVQSNNPGEPVSYTDTEYRYDCMNRVDAVVLYPDGGDPVCTQYFYDYNGNTEYIVRGLSELFSSVTDTPEENPSYLYNYDSLNRVTYQGHSTSLGHSYTYDRAGNILTKTDRNGTKLAYTYDHNGNVTSISSAATGEDVVATNISITYNIFGLPSSKTVDGVTTTYIYDDFGRIISETSGDVTKNYTYDANSNVLSIGVLDGSDSIYSMNYTYDDLNRIVSATSSDIVGTFSYTPNGNVLSSSVGDITTLYTYNNAGFITSFSNSKQQSETYTYARNGNKILTIGTGTGVSRNEYTYDEIGRLVSETADDFSASYTYDNYGNRTSMHRIKDGIVSDAVYTYNVNNQLVHIANAEGDKISEVEYVYDNAGNLVNRIKGFYEPAKDELEESVFLTINESPYVESFAYNALGQLTSYKDNDSETFYTYDGNGNRVSKVNGGYTTKYYWDRGYIVGEVLSGDRSSGYMTSYEASNYVGPQGVFATYREGMRGDVGFYETNYLLKNGHGDVISVAHDNGSEETEINPYVFNYEYDAYGNVLVTNDRTETPFRYCGEYYDEESGLIYLRNRYYDPSIGRFITEDPIRDGLNWYVYCGNNPINRWDPLGLEEGRDKEVLTQNDYEHIQMLTAIYNYAIYSLNDTSIADEVHRMAMEIRQKPEYAGIEGYGPVSTTATSNELQFATFTGSYDDYNYTKSHANVSIVIGEPLSLENVESETGDWIDTMSNAGGFSLIAESFGMDGMIGEFAAFCFGEINKQTNPLYGKVWIGDVVVQVNKTELFHKDVHMRFFFSSDNKSKCYYVER